jgi:hypothetical protein
MSIAQVASENIKSFHSEGNDFVELDIESIAINLTNEVTQESLIFEVPSNTTISAIKTKIQDADGILQFPASQF